jgi:hypothetical protein
MCGKVEAEKLVTAAVAAAAWGNDSRGPGFKEATAAG